MSSRTAWWVAVGLSLGPTVSNGLARFAYGLILPSMRADLGWSYTEAGWINTANAIGYLIGAVLALRLISRTGPQAIFNGGMILTALALLGSALTRDLWLQSAFRILAGVGGAPVFIAGGAMAATLFRGDASRNALAIAVYFGGGGFGMLLTGAVLPILFERAGASAWPTAWLLMAAVSGMSIWPAAAAARAAPVAAQSAALTDKAALPAARMTYELAGYFLFGVGYIVYVTFLVAWMRTKGITPLWIAATWSTLSIAAMLSPFPWRPVLARSNGGGALSLSCLATGIGTLLPIVASGYVGLLLSATIFGVSLYIGPTSVTAFARKNLPEASWGRAVALFTTAFAIGQIIGPVAAGVIVDATQSLALGLIAAGGILVLASLMAALQKPLK